MEKKVTKIDKLNRVVEFLKTAGAEKELIDCVKNEIAITQNKYATAKMKKDSKKEVEYKDLETKVLAFFEKNPNLQIGNADVDLDISTSKKTQVFTRLINKGLVKKIPPKGKQKTVLYQLV